MIIPSSFIAFARGAVTIAATATCFALLEADPVLHVADCWWRFRDRLVHQSNSDSNCNKDPQLIWIVGASTGIGEEVSYQLASGPRVVHLILSSRSKDQLERVARNCRLISDSCSVSVLPLDVCNEKELSVAVKNLHQIANKQPIDTVFLNVGAGHLSLALETTPDIAEQVWRRNTHWIMVLLPMLISFSCNQSNRNSDSTNKLLATPPHIVVTSSIAGILPVPLSAAYSAAKHGLMGYLRSLAAERPDIRLQTVLPGPVDTDFFEHFVYADDYGQRKPQQQEQHKSIEGTVKMSVQRCAQLICSTMRFPHSRESWIASQPLLSVLYWQQWAPGWMQRYLYGHIGRKRVALHQAGLDLYDPASWWKLRTINVTKHDPDKEAHGD